MNAIQRFLWRRLVEPYGVVFSRRTIQLAGSSLQIWRSARSLFQSVLAGERAEVMTPGPADWRLRTVIYGFGNVITTCRGSPAAVDPAQRRSHWESVRAYFAPFDELLQLLARARALAVALFYPGTLVSSGLFYDELETLAPIVVALVILWLVLQIAVPALVRWRLRALFN